MKNLLILGCSYSHWWDGKCFGKSYPALIAQNYPNYHVYDMSEPGGSNDTLYLRLKFLKEEFGVIPDKILIQFTHLSRTNLNLRYPVKPARVSYETLNNYTYHLENDWPDHSLTITPSLIRPDTNSYHMKLLRRLNKITLVNINLLRMFYTWYVYSETNFWNIQKEIDLVNYAYGTQNILSFDWVGHYSPGVHSHISIPNKHLGSISYAFRKKDKFMSLGVDDAPHYGEEGQAEVYKWLSPHLEEFLNAR